MPEQFEPASLAALVAAHLGSGAARRIAPIGTGKHNTSFWIEGARGRFVLRLAPPDSAGLLFYERQMMRQEPEMHALIRAHTAIPVPEIVAHDFGRTRIDRDYLLMTALPGTPLSSTSLTASQFSRVLREVGVHLRDLHALTSPKCLYITGYGYLGAHRPMEPQPTWQDAFGVMWNKLLDDVVASGCYAPDEAQVLRDAYERHRAHFDRPVNAALLHMDIWSENILVDAAGQVTGLIDFDRALWGDPEIEFAVLDYCGISEPPFWEGYGSEREDTASARIRQRFYLLYEIQKYMPIALWRGNDPVEAQQSRRNSLALAAPLLAEG